MEKSNYGQKVIIFTNAWTKGAQRCVAWLADREARLVLNYPPSLKPNVANSEMYWFLPNP